MTNNQFQTLLQEIHLIREQTSRIEERLHEVEIIQATDEMARKVRQDLRTKADLSVQWKIGIGLSIVGSAMQVILQLWGK